MLARVADTFSWLTCRAGSHLILRIIGTLLPLVLISACSKPAEPPRRAAYEETAAEVMRVIPLSDLQFQDVFLQEIATEIVDEARLRGIHELSARNRVDCLLRLEASLGSSQRALDRVNELVRHLVSNDSGPWARLRQQAESRFDGRTGEGARRVEELLARWRRTKSNIAFEYLSSRYSGFISSAEWERRFHEFITPQPLDVATWGWFLMQHDPEQLRQRYGRATAELAYRNYLEKRGVGGAREARRAFSVPGIEVAE